MRKLLPVVFIISLISNGHAQWQKIESPKGIQINKFYHANNELFTCTSNGIYKLDLTEWKKLSEDVNFNISSMTTFDNYFFAGTTTDGIFRSNNNGETWLQVNNSLTTTNVKVLAIYKNTIVAGTSNGLFASDNNGIQWENVSNNIGNKNITAILTFKDSLIVGTSNGIFISSDTAKTWRSINTGLISKNITDLLVVDTIIYASTTNGGIFSTNNTGETWNEINSGLTNKNTNCLFSVNDSLFVGTTDTLYYAADLSNILWKTMPLGQSSEEILSITTQNNLLTVGNSYGAFIKQNEFTELNTGFPNWNISNLSTFDTALFLSTNVGVWKYNNSWDLVTNFPDNSIKKLISMNDSVQLMFNSKGLFMSSDTLKDWTTISTKTNITCLLIKDTIIFFGTNGDGVFRSNDKGTSWLPVNIGFTSKKITKMVSLGNYIFALSDLIYKTANMGDQWDGIEGSSGSSTIAIKKSALYKTNSVGIYRSEDMGETWQPVLEPDYGYKNNIYSTKSLVILDTIMFNLDYGVNISDDNDTMWYTINKGFNSYYTIKEIDMIGKQLYIWNAGNYIWKRDISSISHPKAPSNVRFYNQYYIDDPGGMASYGIQGMIKIDWENNSDISKIVIRRYWGYADITLDSKNHPISFNIDTLSESPDYYEVPFYLYYNDDGDLSPMSEASVLDNKLIAVNNTETEENSIYPNPVENTLFIKMSDKISKGSLLCLYNSDGQCVYKSTINNNYTFDFSAYNAGIYFITITDNNKTILSEKIIKK